MEIENTEMLLDEKEKEEQGATMQRSKMLLDDKKAKEQDGDIENSDVVLDDHEGVKTLNARDGRDTLEVKIPPPMLTPPAFC
jgi:hypothetical protein